MQTPVGHLGSHSIDVGRYRPGVDETRAVGQTVRPTLARWWGRLEPVEKVGVGAIGAAVPVAVTVLLAGTVGHTQQPLPTRTTAPAVVVVQPAPVATEPSTAAPTPTPTSSPRSPAAKPTTRRPAVRKTTAKPPVRDGVHPGAFCKPHGARGRTSTGRLMVCTTTASDSRNRWRAV